MGESRKLWFKVLTVRYGDIKIQVSNGGDKYLEKVSKSFYWLDNISLYYKHQKDFFIRGCRFRVGNSFLYLFGILGGWRREF